MHTPPPKAGEHHLEVTTATSFWERVILFAWPTLFRRRAARVLLEHFAWPKDRSVPSGMMTFSLPNGGGVWEVTDGAGSTRPFEPGRGVL